MKFFGFLLATLWLCAHSSVFPENTHSETRKKPIQYDDHSKELKDYSDNLNNQDAYDDPLKDSDYTDPFEKDEYDEDSFHFEDNDSLAANDQPLKRAADTNVMPQQNQPHEQQLDNQNIQDQPYEQPLDRQHIQDKPYNQHLDNQNFQGQPYELPLDKQHIQGQPYHQHLDNQHFQGQSSNSNLDNQNFQGQPYELPLDRQNIQGQPYHQHLDNQHFQGQSSNLNLDNQNFQGQPYELPLDYRHIQGQPYNQHLDNQHLQGYPYGQQFDNQQFQGQFCGQFENQPNEDPNAPYELTAENDPVPNEILVGEKVPQTIQAFLDNFSEGVKRDRNLNPAYNNYNLDDDNKINKIEFLFESSEHLYIPAARRLMLSIANGFLSLINSDEKIRPFLAKVPFPLNNLEIRIQFFSDDVTYPRMGNVASVSLVNGSLNFDTLNSFNYRVERLRSESFIQSQRLDENL